MADVLKLFKGRSLVVKWVSEYLLSNPQRMILLSFALVIFVGTALLMHPDATNSRGSLHFIDAFFTATSATCVTGLVVVETSSAFTTFGQMVILCLIQLGGLGIMTFSTFFMFLLVGRLSIAGRDILVDTFSQNPMMELIRLLRTVFIFTIVLEVAGWLLLSARFYQDFPVREALYQGAFHSISAFCNAGFFLLENGYYNYATNGYFNLVNILLIISGGLGFIVILDIRSQLGKERKHFFSRLSLHSKITLTATLSLVVVGALAFYLFEFNGSLGDHSVFGKIWIAIFQSVTTRTAGFNTIPIEALSLPTLFIIIILMVIGASPGSCGGGIKTTTFVLFLQNLLKQFSDNKDINVFARRIPDVTLARATAIVFFAIFTIGFFVFVLLTTEIYFQGHKNQDIGLMDILFEVVSAFGTVGLSTGITASLSPVGKILITILMYVGRLGPITLVFALKSGEVSRIRYMKEDILVG